MPRIEVNVSGYSHPYARLNGRYRWFISQLQLMHAVTVVGLPHYYLAYDSISAIQFSQGKSMLVSSAIDWTSQIVVSPTIYPRLDPSEKGNISYWLGMAFCKIVAEKLLNIKILMHAGMLLRYGVLDVANLEDKRLADLIGQDTLGNWHVLEAKGRSSWNTADLRTWKEQASTVTHINNNRVATNTRCSTHTSNRYWIDVEDPDGIEDGVRYEVAPEELEGIQLRAIRDILNQESPYISKDFPFPTRQIAYDLRTQSDVYIGLVTDFQDIPRSTGSDYRLFAGSEGIALIYRGGNLRLLDDNQNNNEDGSIVEDGNDQETE